MNETKCYRKDCPRPAVCDIHWNAYPDTDPACQPHAILIQQRCPQVGRIDRRR